MLNPVSEKPIPGRDGPFGAPAFTTCIPPVYLRPGQASEKSVEDLLTQHEALLKAAGHVYDCAQSGTLSGLGLDLFIHDGLRNLQAMIAEIEFQTNVAGGYFLTRAMDALNHMAFNFPDSTPAVTAMVNLLGVMEVSAPGLWRFELPGEDIANGGIDWGGAELRVTAGYGWLRGPGATGRALMLVSHADGLFWAVDDDWNARRPLHFAPVPPRPEPLFVSVLGYIEGRAGRPMPWGHTGLEVPRPEQSPLQQFLIS